MFMAIFAPASHRRKLAAGFGALLAVGLGLAISLGAF
jgi:hypothetical protein